MTWAPHPVESFARRPCRAMTIDGNEYCSAESGEHTALDYPICDACYSLVKET